MANDDGPGQQTVAWQEIDGSESPRFTNKSRDPAYWGDKWFFRGVMLALGAALVVATGGLIGIALSGKTVPEGLVAIASGTIGAFAGAIVPGRTIDPYQDD